MTLVLCNAKVVRIDSGTGKTMFTEVSVAQVTTDIAQPCRGHRGKKGVQWLFSITAL